MSTHEALMARLEALARRYDGVNRQLAEAASARAGTTLVQLSKEAGRLRRLVEPYRRYQTQAKHLAESQAILDDPGSDPELRELADAELPELQAECERILADLQDQLLMGEEASVTSIMLEIRAGTGGEEAALFARNLYEMYLRYCQARGFTVEVLDSHASDMGGFKEIILNVKGEGVYTALGYEGGGHRVQRVPETEAQGRIHTSAATVAVLPEAEEVDVEINWDKDVIEHVSRAGGPGGQNVNKVSSAIRLEHRATGITVSMRDEKSQHKNRAKARRVLLSRVRDLYLSKERAARDTTRRVMIGSGDRSQRIRTYNFPQSRVTDHRIGQNFNLEQILAGNLHPLIEALQANDRQERLKKL
jgi:peptide chain release factor 1